MRRFQMMIDEELDEALGRQAAAEGVSKAELLRRYAREQVKPLPPIEEDPLWELVGMIKDGGSPDDSMRVDEVVYDPGR
jgi:Ribbon-helix-helix protein, copG family